jgi:hypothetical protein
MGTPLSAAGPIIEVALSVETTSGIAIIGLPRIESATDWSHSPDQSLQINFCSSQA